MNLCINFQLNYTFNKILSGLGNSAWIVYTCLANLLGFNRFAHLVLQKFDYFFQVVLHIHAMLSDNFK